MWLLEDDGSFSSLGIVTTLALLHKGRIAFCAIYEFSISRSQVFALGPRCCIFSISMSAIPAAVAGLSLLIANSSPSVWKSLARGLTCCGWSDTTVQWCSPI